MTNLASRYEMLDDDTKWEEAQQQIRSLIARDTNEMGKSTVVSITSTQPVLSAKRTASERADVVDDGQKLERKKKRKKERKSGR